MLIVTGLGYKQIAYLLGISVDTVRRHGSRIKQKSRLNSTVSLACFDIPSGLIRPLLQTLAASSPLVDSELAVLENACLGLSAKEIARLRGTSPRTIEKQRETAMAKLYVRSVLDLASLVRRQYETNGMPNA